MSILDDLDLDPSDEAGLARAISRAAAGGSWQAAAFLLQHAPQHRERWGDQAALERVRDRLLGCVARGIERSGLTPEQQLATVLSIQAEGAGAKLPEASHE